MEISKVRQALDNVINCLWKRKCNQDIDYSCKILDQAITDYENTLNNLNDANTILGDYKKENKELKRENEEFIKSNKYLNDFVDAMKDTSSIEKINDRQDFCLRVWKLEKENEKLKKAYKLEKELICVEQAIEPSVLEKIDKLEKQLAITDKALELACNDMALSYNEEKEKYKKEYLEKAKEITND